MILLDLIAGVFALPLWPLVISAAACGWLLYSVSIDVSPKRNGDLDAKWPALFVTLLLFIVLSVMYKGANQSTFSFLVSAELWSPVLHWAFWGLLFCPVQLFFMLRKREKSLAKYWALFLKEKLSKIRGAGLPDRLFGEFVSKDLISQTPKFQDTFFGTWARADRVEGDSIEREYDRVLHKTLQHFVTECVPPWDREFLDLKSDVLNNTVSVKINRSYLKWGLPAWIMLWPAYLINLLLSDALIYMVDKAADALRGFADKAIKVMFRDTFSVEKQ